MSSCTINIDDLFSISDVASSKTKLEELNLTIHNKVKRPLLHLLYRTQKVFHNLVTEWTGILQKYFLDILPMEELDLAVSNILLRPIPST